MDASTIKQTLAKKDIRLSDISRDLGIKLPSVSQVIHGRRPSRRVSQAIADAIGLPLEEVFPKYRKESQSHRTGAREAA